MANIGSGAQLQLSTDGVSYTTIGKLTTIGDITIGEADTIDATTYDSPNGHREKIRGLIDAGSIDFTGNWEGSASQVAPITRLQTGPTSTLDYIKVVFPNSLGTWTARGFVGSLKISPPMDDKIEFSGTLEISGKPTLNIP